MRSGKVIGEGGFYYTNRVNPLRRNFRRRFPAQKNTGLKVGHKLVGTKRVIVTDEMSTERRDCKYTAGKHGDQDCVALRQLRDGRSLIPPAKNE